MVGRAATAIKSKTAPKPRLGAKATAQVSVTKAAQAKAAQAKAAQANVSLPPLPAAAAPEASPPVKPRRRTKVETRTRIYWAVFNQDCKRVAVFEFDQKSEAEKRAAKLMSTSGEHHFIQKIKAVVPVS